jgi:hypothetical protein
MAGVLGLVLRSRWVKRLSRGVPIARLLLLGDVGVMAWRHIARLERAERASLLTLLARTRARPGTLTGAERRELARLLARLEPRLFFGTALRRLSPVPVPKRLLYGPRGSAARKAIAAGQRR